MLRPRKGKSFKFRAQYENKVNLPVHLTETLQPLITVFVELSLANIIIL